MQNPNQIGLFDGPRSTVRPVGRVPLPVASPGETLASAIDYVRDNVEESGASCPCCGKFVRAYARKMNKSMVNALVWIYTAGQGAEGSGRLALSGRPWLSVNDLNHSFNGRWGGWVNVPDTAPAWLTRTNQHPTLAWWGLLQARRDVSGYDGADSVAGQWRATPLARRFLMGVEAVPAAALTYNGSVYGFSEDLVTPSDIVKGFDYDEAMRPVADYDIF